MMTTLPTWAFEVALFLAQQRQGNFRNRFRNRRLRQLHETEDYVAHCESVMGYMGDVGAAILFGVDPFQMITAMIDGTDGLAHRDEADISINGRNIDVKLEDYDRWHDAVLEDRLQPNQPYGCRLINKQQW